MALTPNHPLSFRGASFTKAAGHCCAAMRQVAISNWNKTAGAGFEV
jgi:hypothetical protein